MGNFSARSRFRSASARVSPTAMTALDPRTPRSRENLAQVMVEFRAAQVGVGVDKGEEESSSFAIESGSFLCGSGILPRSRR